MSEDRTYENILLLQQRWLDTCGVPVPDHQLLFGVEDALDVELRKLLMEFGANVAWLEAQLGMMEGKSHALKESYKTAVAIGSAGMTKGTEKAKEATVIAESEALKSVRWQKIEQEVLILTARGLLEAYKRGWDTVSRTITSRIAERELATTRHA